METCNSKPTSRFTTAIASISLLLLLFLSLPSQSLACHEQDRNALLKIKEALNSPPLLASWDPNTDCCSWDGVHCDAGFANGERVIVLNIFGVTGVAPGHISPAIGDLTYLKTLYMDNANLIGPIPYTLTNLKNLSFIRMTHNRLSGPIPAFLNQLDELAAIVLSYNYFSGTLPPTLSKLPKLLTLSLDHNKLTGPIPESWGKFAGSGTPNFDLSHNFLAGNLPKSFADMNHYYSIDLSHNNFVGDASLLFGESKTVNEIYLSSNKFEFDLSKVEVPPFLSDFLIDHNHIYGSLPRSFREFDFQQFNVSYNDLCGPIPQGGNLESFDPTAFGPNKCLCGTPLAPCKAGVLSEMYI